MVSVVCAQMKKILCMASTYILFHMLNTTIQFIFEFECINSESTCFDSPIQHIEFEQMVILRFHESR